MITIIRREFMDHLRSLQFTALLVLSVILFAANGLVFVKSYSREVDVYQKRITRTGPPSVLGAFLRRQPNPLTFVAEGGDRDRAPGYTLFQKGTLMPEPTNPRTFKLPDFPPLDWSFIVRMLLGLYVLLLGYEGISGEKERGTLRLVLANSLGRARLLAAKYAAILLTAAVPLVIGLLVNLLIIGIFVPQVISLSVLSRIAVVVLLSLAYISLFAFLSLLFSALISKSSLVLLALLAIWVVFTVVIPSSAVILVEKLSSSASEIQTAKMFEPMVQKEVWAKIDDIRNRASSGTFKSEDEIKAATDKAFEDGQDKVNQFYDNYDKAQRSRADTAKALSRLSPAALFQYAAEDIVQTGDSGEEEFLKQVRAYSRVYDQYVLKKTGKLVQTSRWSFSTDFVFQGKKIDIHSPRPEPFRGDTSDFPKFAEQRSSLGEGLKNALGDLAGLIVWNILLAGLAFAVFLRADVR
jgi:ABC-type transport system involved in multi-copper enzyme maturation permease subunit